MLCFLDLLILLWICMKNILVLKRKKKKMEKKGWRMTAAQELQ